MVDWIYYRVLVLPPLYGLSNGPPFPRQSLALRGSSLKEFSNKMPQGDCCVVRIGAAGSRKKAGNIIGGVGTRLLLGIPTQTITDDAATSTRT